MPLVTIWLRECYIFSKGLAKSVDNLDLYVFDSGWRVATE